MISKKILNYCLLIFIVLLITLYSFFTLKDTSIFESRQPNYAFSAVISLPPYKEIHYESQCKIAPEFFYEILFSSILTSDNQTIYFKDVVLK